jgi:hypothetical protein
MMPNAEELNQRELVERGYTTTQLLTGEEAAALWRELQALKQEAGFGVTDGTGSRLKHHASFMDADQTYRRQSSALIERWIGSRMAKVIPDLVFATGSFHIKGPHSGTVGLHRDWTLTEDPAQLSYNAWLSLVDVDENNGALRVVPHSHDVTVQLSTAKVRPYYASYVDAVESIAVPVPVKAGEAIVYNSRLLHWSAENQSADVRPAVGIGLIPAGTRPAFYKAKDDGSSYVVYDMSGGEFLRHSPADLYAGRISAPVLKEVDHRNEALDLKEFTRRIEQLRRGRKEPPPVGPPSRLQSLLSRARSHLSAGSS